MPANRRAQPWLKSVVVAGGLIAAALQRGGAAATEGMVSAVILGCSAGPATSPARYRTRGLVVDVDPGPPRRLLVHHEAIAGFLGRDGQRSDMAAMKMAFGLRPGLHNVLVTAGDKVELEFEVNYGARETLTITGLTVLPTTTPLQR